MASRMLDPKRDLTGATPEKLACALLHNPLRPRPGVQPVAGNEVAEQEVVMSTGPRPSAAYRSAFDLFLRFPPM